jgi:hypothetical protein
MPTINLKHVQQQCNVIEYCVWVCVYIGQTPLVLSVSWELNMKWLDTGTWASTGKCLSSSTHSVEYTLRYIPTWPSRWLVTSFLNIFNFPFILLSAPFFYIYIYIIYSTYVLLEISEHFVLHYTLVCIYYSNAERPLTTFLALVNAKWDIS